MLLVYLAVAWAIGIAVASTVSLPIEIWLLWLVLPVGLFLIWRRAVLLRTLHLCLLVFLLGAIRSVIALPPSEWKETDLAFYNDHDEILMIGNVVDPPDVRDRTVQIHLAVMRVRVGRDPVWHDVSGLALIQAPRETEARYGDQLQVYGEPTTPPVLEDFSYKDYLARKGIHSLVRVYGGVKTLARDQGNPFFAALYAFRDRGVATIYAIFPDPSASLLAGILFGVDSGIPSDVKDAFSATNTAHIVAISGLNRTQTLCLPPDRTTLTHPRTGSSFHANRSKYNQATVATDVVSSQRELLCYHLGAALRAVLPIPPKFVPSDLRAIVFQRPWTQLLCSPLPGRLSVCEIRSGSLETHLD